MILRNNTDTNTNNLLVLNYQHLRYPTNRQSFYPSDENIRRNRQKPLPPWSLFPLTATACHNKTQTLKHVHDLTHKEKNSGRQNNTPGICLRSRKGPLNTFVVPWVIVTSPPPFHIQRLGWWTRGSGPGTQPVEAGVPWTRNRYRQVNKGSP